MSANKELYVRYQEALTTKDPTALDAAIDAVMAPDFVGHDQPPGVPPGTAGLKQFRHRTHAAFPDQRVVVEDMIEEGARVAGRVSVTMTHLGEFQGSSDRPADHHGVRRYRSDRRGSDRGAMGLY